MTLEVKDRFPGGVGTPPLTHRDPRNDTKDFSTHREPITHNTTSGHRAKPAGIGAFSQANRQVIRDGIDVTRVNPVTPRRLQGALTRLAVAAMAQGAKFDTFRGVILDSQDRAGGGIMGQLRFAKAKPVSGRAIEGQIVKAWKYGAKRYDESAHTYARRVRDNRLVIARIIHQDALTPIHAALLAILGDEMKRYGLPNVVMPVRRIQELLAERGIIVAQPVTVSRHLNRLVEMGYLHLVVKGKARLGGSGKASIYTLDRGVVAAELDKLWADHYDPEAIDQVELDDLPEPGNLLDLVYPPERTRYAIEQ